MKMFIHLIFAILFLSAGVNASIRKGLFLFDQPLTKNKIDKLKSKYNLEKIIIFDDINSNFFSRFYIVNGDVKSLDKLEENEKNVSKRFPINKIDYICHCSVNEFLYNKDMRCKNILTPNFCNGVKISPELFLA